MGAGDGEIPAASAGMTDLSLRGDGGKCEHALGDMVGVEADVFLGEVAALGGGLGHAGGGVVEDEQVADHHSKSPPALRTCALRPSMSANVTGSL